MTLRWEAPVRIKKCPTAVWWGWCAGRQTFDELKQVHAYIMSETCWKVGMRHHGIALRQNHVAMPAARVRMRSALMGC